MFKTQTASNAKLQYEAGQDISELAAMVDSGDHKVFSITGIAPWSGKSGYEPKIRRMVDFRWRSNTQHSRR